MSCAWILNMLVMIKPINQTFYSINIREFAFLIIYNPGYSFQGVHGPH